MPALLHMNAVFSEFIKSLSVRECSTRQFRHTTLLSIMGYRSVDSNRLRCCLSHFELARVLVRLDHVAGTTILLDRADKRLSSCYLITWRARRWLEFFVLARPLFSS